MRKKKQGIFIAIALLFFFPALYGAGGVGLWLDEIMSLDFCDGSVTQLFQSLKADVHAPVFYIILFVFVKILGISELAGRMPGILAGAGTVFALAVLSGELRMKKAARAISCLLVCLSPFFLEFSREIHPYSLSALLAVSSWIFYLRLVKKGRIRDGALYGLFTGLLILTFYLGILIPITQGILFLFLRPSNRKKKSAFAGWLIAFFLFLPWLPVFIRQLTENRISVIESYFPEGVGMREAVFLLGDIFFGTFFRSAGYIPMVFVLLAVMIVFMALLLRDPSKFRKRTILWMLWCPLILFFLLGLWKPIFLSRYLTMVSPFAALFSGAAVSRIRGFKWKLPVIAAMIALYAIGYGGYLKSMPRENWQGSAVFLTDRLQPTDIIVTDGVNASSCLGYYFEILDEPRWNRNLFTYEQFYGASSGRYQFADRTLWYLDRNRPENRDQLEVLKEKNTRKGEALLPNGFTLHSFRGKE